MTYPLWLQNRKKRLGKTPYLAGVLSLLPPGCVVADLGAGPGTYVAALIKAGYRAVGYDGTPGIEELTVGLVKYLDLAAVDFPIAGSAEWAMCLDVGEHVPADLEQSFLDNIGSVATDGMIASWGLPGTRGWHHVNCRSLAYVIGEFVSRGWYMDEPARNSVRRLMSRKEWWRLMVFRRSARG